MIPAEIIKELVEASDMTHAQIAERCGYAGTRGLQSVLYNSKHVTIRTADKIVCALGDPWAWYREPLCAYYLPFTKPKVCAREGCEQEFYAEGRRACAMYCSKECKHEVKKARQRGYMRDYMSRLRRKEGVHDRSTHCRHGHERTPENTYVDPKGIRCCRICRQEGLVVWRLTREAA